VAVHPVARAGRRIRLRPVAFGLQQAVFPIRIGEILLLVIALSMLLTPLAFIASDWIAQRLGNEATARGGEADEIDEPASIIIAGIGRFGQVVNRMVQASGFKTVVLDNDLATIQLMRRFGFKGYFGDPSRPELLKAAGLGDGQGHRGRRGRQAGCGRPRALCPAGAPRHRDHRPCP
jgi:CPA2 family monovalent cation:H+ antiporter-2